MSKKLLEIRDLRAGVTDRQDKGEILQGLDLEINAGEIHVILGPNGSGKSTLMNVIMGHPKYEVTGGSIGFEGEDLQVLKTFERARRGIFLSFQNPEEIPGITVENMLRASRQAVTGKPVKIMKFRKELKAAMEELQIEPEYAGRYMNVGFSGGEKKRNEILQLLLLNPKLALLDETDSGLDVDAVQIVSSGVRKFHNEENACLIITHNTRILEQLSVDRVHVLLNGRIVEDIERTLYEIRNEDRSAYKSQAGLTEAVVRDISARKHDPEWMLERRLESLKVYNSLRLPTWGPDLSELNMEESVTYVQPDAKMAGRWEDVPEDIKSTFDRLGIPEAEKVSLAGVGAQYDSEVVYHSIQDSLIQQGVLYTDMETALR